MDANFEALSMTDCEHLQRIKSEGIFQLRCLLKDKSPSPYQCRICTDKTGISPEPIEKLQEPVNVDVDTSRCDGCEHYNKVSEHCRRYGCVARSRIPNIDVHCPVGKW